MGVDLYGYIEIKKAEVDESLGEAIWFFVVDVDILVERNTDAFGCLFGVRNPNHFVPVAANRGVPHDASRIGQHANENPEWFHSHTWVTWRELRQVNWQESVERRKDENSQEPTFSAKSERITRAEAVGDTFDLVFDLMKRLAQSFGDDSVRLVVWFVC